MDMELGQNLPHQEALPLRLRDQENFATFIKAGDGALIDAMYDAAINGRHDFYLVTGPRGSGKSHLLSAVALEIPEAFNVDLALAKAFSPEFIDIKLPKVTLIDNVDAIAGDIPWELAVFSLFNRWYDAPSGTLIISSTPSFDRIPFERHDLNTRLGSGIFINLEPLSERDCIEALILRGKSRGYALSESVAGFMVRHCNRDMPELIALLDKLDKVQLQEKRGITVPFVKKVLAL